MMCKNKPASPIITPKQNTCVDKIIRQFLIIFYDFYIITQAGRHIKLSIGVTVVWRSFFCIGEVQALNKMAEWKFLIA